MYPYFKQYINDQEILEHPKRRDRLLSVIPPNLIDKLGDLENLTLSKIIAVLGKHYPFALKDIVFTYLYPRMDKNVSLHRNHLLKAPFCLHPSTGNVCVPIPLEHIHIFPVGKSPNMFELLDIKKRVEKEDDDEKEEDQSMKMEEENEEEEEVKEYLNYTFDQYVQFFNDFVNELVGMKKEQK